MLHPIYSFIRNFHVQFEKLIQQSLQNEDGQLVLGHIYYLVKDILFEVPDQQFIKRNKNRLQAKVYKKAVEQWFLDWVDGGHTAFEEVLHLFNFSHEFLLTLVLTFRKI